MATPSEYSAIVEQIYTDMQAKGYNGTMADLALALSNLSDSNPATTKWIDLGASSAYAIYVEHGGTMSEAEWIEYLSTVSEKSEQAHTDAQSAKESAEAAEEAKDAVIQEKTHIIEDIQSEGNTQVQAVTNKGTEQVGAVNTAGTTQVNAVNAAGTTQVTAVNTAGSTQVTAVQAQGTTSKDAVTAEGEKQVERVSNQGTAEVQAVSGEGTRQTTALQTVATGLEGDIRDVGQEVLNSIPEDYTDLQSAINNSVDLTAYPWAIGAFNSTGDEIASTTRIRSGFIPVSEGDMISIDSTSPLLNGVFYDADGVFKSNMSGWGTSVVVPSGAGFFRFLVRKSTSNPTITESDIPDLVAICNVNLLIPKSVYKINETVSDIKSFKGFDFEKFPYSNGYLAPYIISYAQGAIDGETGADESAARTNRVRTGFIYGDSTISVLIPQTYIFRLFRYNKTTDAFISVTAWANGKLVSCSPLYKYKIMFAMPNYSNNIVPQDVNNNTFAYIGELNDIFNDSYIVPEYYEEYMYGKIAEIQQNMFEAGRHGETFVFITDLHWETNNKHSPALINRILQNTNIQTIVCGGDLINEGTKLDMENTMQDCVSSFNYKKHFFPCAFGNHDSNQNNQGSLPERWFDTETVYTLMYKQNDERIHYITDNEWKAFYFDNETTKTRFIFCDTGVDSWAGTIDTTSQSYWTYVASDQLDQLVDCMLDTAEGWEIVLVAHWIRGLNNFTAFGNDLSAIADGINNKSSAVDASGAAKVYNLSSAKAHVCAIFAGHTHFDFSATTTGGIPIVITDCDNGVRTSNTDYPYVYGTITEQCFDVVTINYEAETVKCVRVGRGANRSFTY